MSRRFCVIAVLISLAAGFVPIFADGSGSPPIPLRRFALIAGSNNGGPARIRLKYATSDAKAFASVLKELGGVKDSDMILLTDPDLNAFEAGIRKVQQMAASPRDSEERRELLIYYSGHSNEEGLILGAETMPYDVLRKHIVDVPADVHVAVLDSCASGALTRAKGGVWRPAFLFDVSSDMKGHAFLTSSSAEESAQESDKIGASFFTHYLVSGMRGAADTNSDGLVTLNEAYAFAFQETLASTEKTQYGPQHPAYDINLTGSGDLVFTDLRAASAGLTVAEDVSGRIYIRDSHGFLAVELNKSAGQRVELGLEPGVYSIVLDGKEARYRAEVRISANKRSVLASTDLVSFSADKTVSRGDEEAAEEIYQDGEPIREDEQIAEKAEPSPQGWFHFTLVPSLLNWPASSNGEWKFSLNAFVGISAVMSGFELGGFVNIETESMLGSQLAGLANIVTGEVNGFQAAGLLNYSGTDSRFLQLAGIANVNEGGFSGFMSSGVGNVALGDSSGFGMAGVFSYTRGYVSGGQVSGLVNLAFGGLDGVQVSGVANWAAGESKGAQISGVFNFARDFFKGAQISGVANYAGELYGPQFSVINIADTVTGAQVGLVNIAGNVKGVQVGLINIARVIDGIPIGLLTFEQAGRQSLEVWWDTDMVWHLGFKFGSKYTYTILMGSYAQASDPIRWSVGAGFGGHIPFDPFFADVDLSWQFLETGTSEWLTSAFSNQLPELRAVLGLTLFGISVNAGVSIDAYIPYISKEPDGTVTEIFRLAPRFILGVQL